jgi:hypothetical protein
VVLLPPATWSTSHWTDVAELFSTFATNCTVPLVGTTAACGATVTLTTVGAGTAEEAALPAFPPLAHELSRETIGNINRHPQAFERIPQSFRQAQGRRLPTGRIA